MSTQLQEALRPSPGAPYLAENHPRSEGRVLLSRALEHYAAVEWGYGPRDIAEVFRSLHTREGRCHDLGFDIRNACDNLIDLMLVDRLRTFARPLGGGSPVRLANDLWEIDNPLARFATSAFDPARPYDVDAEPTHWIFVDEGDLAEIVHVMCGGAPSLPAMARNAGSSEVAVPIRTDADGDTLLRLSVVEELTGMSRSTVYAKVARGDFPEPLRLGARFSRWRRSEVERWLASPR